MDYMIRQGDQYLVPFYIILGNNILDPTVVDEVIISFGPDLVKSYKDGEVRYNARRHCYEFPLTQEETLDLYPGMRLCSELRYKLKQLDVANANESEYDGFISSYDGPSIVIISSNSKEII